MEDYKEKYEQALFRMNKWVEGSEITDPKEVAEFVFPELRESEDERIRKNLREFLLDAPSQDIVDHHLDLDETLNWLQKYGKIKRQDYPYIPGWRENRPDNKPKIKHSILMLTTHGVAEGEWLGEEWCQYRWSCKIKDTEVLYWLHLSDLETILSKWINWLRCIKVFPINNTDKSFIDDIKNIINEAPGVLQADKNKLIEWLEKQGEHANFRNKIQIGDEVTRNEDGALVNLSQFKRMVKQGKQKSTWSEEDEKIFNVICEELSSYIRIEGYSTPLSVADINWLKSLKERMKGE